MTWTVAATGITTVSSTNEVTIATDTTNGTYVLEVDTTNLVLGGLLEIRIKTATATAGTTAQAWKASYQHPQINNHKISPPVASDASITCTLTMPAGSGTAAYNWKLLRI